MEWCSITVGSLFKITAVPFRASVGRPLIGGTTADKLLERGRM